MPASRSRNTSEVSDALAHALLARYERLYAYQKADEQQESLQQLMRRLNRFILRHRSLVDKTFRARQRPDEWVLPGTDAGCEVSVTYISRQRLSVTFTSLSGPKLAQITADLHKHDNNRLVVFSAAAPRGEHLHDTAQWSRWLARLENALGNSRKR